MFCVISGEMFSSPIRNRAFWWLHGWAGFLDGAIKILFLGLVYSELAGAVCSLGVTGKLTKKMPLFGANVGHIGDLSLLEERLYWWIHAWADLVDGLVEVLSLGFFSATLGSDLSGWRIQRRIAMSETEAGTKAVALEV